VYIGDECRLICRWTIPWNSYIELITKVNFTLDIYATYFFLFLLFSLLPLQTHILRLKSSKGCQFLMLVHLEAVLKGWVSSETQSDEVFHWHYLYLLLYLWIGTFYIQWQLFYEIALYNIHKYIIICVY